VAGAILGGSRGHIPQSKVCHPTAFPTSEIFGEYNWTTGMKIYRLYFGFMPRTAYFTYNRQIFPVTGPLWRPIALHCPQSGGARTAPGWWGGGWLSWLPFPPKLHPSSMRLSDSRLRTSLLHSRVHLSQFQPCQFVVTSVPGNLWCCLCQK